MYNYRIAETNDYPIVCTFPENADELYYLNPKATFPLTPLQIEVVPSDRLKPVVLLDNDQIIGFAGLYGDGEKLDLFWLGSVIISTEYRGMGAGEYLIKALISFARTEMGAKAIHLICHNTNTRGLLFYAKLDFKPYEFEERKKPDGTYYVAIKMKLMLD